MGRAVGNLTISGGNVSFSGYDGDGVNIKGNGSVSPQVPSPGVNYNGAILTYDSIDTLSGRHDLITPGSYAGRDDASVQYKQQFGETNPIKIIAQCSLNNRTNFNSGSIEFNIN
jgi:hypothetical protein